MQQKSLLHKTIALNIGAFLEHNEPCWVSFSTFGQKLKNLFHFWSKVEFFFHFWPKLEDVLPLFVPNLGQRRAKNLHFWPRMEDFLPLFVPPHPLGQKVARLLIFVFLEQEEIGSNLSEFLLGLREMTEAMLYCEECCCLLLFKHLRLMMVV